MSESLIYFDNAATSFPKAPGVNEAMGRFLAEDAANPGRAGHRMAVAAEQMLDNVRLKLTRLFDADEPERMVFTLNGTDALNIAIKGVLGDGGGAHVITTDLEHNSVSRPLQAMADRGAIELTRIPFDDDGFIDAEDVRKAIKSNTKLIVLTHASNVLGTIQDAEAVGRIAREHDVLFCLDAAQTAGVLPVSVKQMQIDLLAFPGHKSLLGPTGTGALYVGERCPASSLVVDDKDRLNPWREGGTGGDSSTPTQPAEFPYYLEGGTPNTVGIAGLGAGIDFVNKQGQDIALAHEQQMVQALIDRFADDARFTVYGTRDAARRVGTLSLNVNGFDAPDVGSILDDSFNIAVRPGLHCAPYAHRWLGTFPDGAVRVSPGAFSTAEELDQLIEALDQVAG
jgi:cysteine desulfurase family protein